MTRTRSLRSQAVSPKLDTSSRPSSPTFSETTNASVLDFGPDGPHKIITRAHLKMSMQAYEDLLNKSAAYRGALLAMSRATAGFADAMGVCAGLKGPNYESGTRLQVASGLHHLMSNHFHVLAETLDMQFEKPLRQHFEDYRRVVNERSNAYEKALREKSNLIRQTEMGNYHRKGRSLQTFREALAILQRQVDELDDLKEQHYQEIIEHEERVWDFVQGKVCYVVRSTLDIFDRFTSKASDPVIEPMLQTVPDPFDAYGPPPSEDQIFTILPPLSVIANAPSSTPSPLTSTATELDSSDGIPSAKSSWTPSTGGFFPDTSAAWADVPMSSPPRIRSATSPVAPARSASPQTVDATIAAPPPSSLNRRHSLPPASGSPPTINHQPRRSESKLRSVLSVIDESHSRQNGEANNVPDTADSPELQERQSISPPVDTPPINGKETSPAHSGQWAFFSFPSARPSNGDSEAGQQNITLSQVQSPPMSPRDSLTPRAERSRSPQSDDTAIPITT
ncbi:uncharacterized protein LAESUDRAFT_740202 [Laetiporus sulphureus 93-53]|uniref:IMD domain-containing protein n=1 Tax=Laetiporus sulphureus 93-53 TaxID=1314785 RepID=A0A165IE21_9APHY|nr:uncharacterized protein LAESUDRAFT_740202 [Laetiporus sulphureus 93-53]KZT12949.1 hypothetical protein LAESUDRAFT_740202 [Laetiporus sulphureus 93-53]